MNEYGTILRKIGNRYKKMKNHEKTNEIFTTIIGMGTKNISDEDPQSIEKTLIDIIRFTDIRFVRKIAEKEKNSTLLETLEAAEKILDEREKARSDHDMNMMNQHLVDQHKERLGMFKKLGIRGYKMADISLLGENEICASCRENAKAGWIYADEPFPSGHQHAPFADHDDNEGNVYPCNCGIRYASKKEE